MLVLHKDALLGKRLNFSMHFCIAFLHSICFQWFLKIHQNAKPESSDFSTTNISLLGPEMHCITQHYFFETIMIFVGNCDLSVHPNVAFRQTVQRMQIVGTTSLPTFSVSLINCTVVLSLTVSFNADAIFLLLQQAASHTHSLSVSPLSCSLFPSFRLI
jgi:hypothetical protein